MEYKTTGTSMWVVGMNKSMLPDTPDMVRCFINNQIVEVIVMEDYGKLILHDPFLKQYRQYDIDEYDSTGGDIGEFIVEKINKPDTQHEQDWHIEQRFTNWKRFFDMAFRRGNLKWRKLDEPIRE